jgi:hypothetical protein
MKRQWRINIPIREVQVQTAFYGIENDITIDRVPIKISTQQGGKN